MERSAPEPDYAPWRARIRTADDRVLGAGVVVGTDQVLTCAHVVMDQGLPAGGPRDTVPKASVVVDFVGRPDLALARARIMPGCWVPPLPNERGDLALLKLERAVPEGCAARLLRVPPWNQVVHTFGYPVSLDSGVWVRATLAGRGGPGDEWVQMNQLQPQGIRVRKGFSGSGVVDDTMEHVVGVIVGEYTDDEAGLSWMIPVDTIVRYLPEMAGRVAGGGTVDPRFVEQFGARPADTGTGRLITSFFARAGTDRVLVVVTGDSGSPASAALCRAVVLSSSIDLAIDVTGKTVEEVSRRIAEWMGVRVDGAAELSDHLTAGMTPMGLVVDRVDEAADPDALVSEVLIPLAGRNVRLLVGVRREPPPSVDVLRAVGSGAREYSAAEDAGLVARRIGSLAVRIEEVATAERAARRRHREVAPRITGVPDAPSRSAMLRLKLTEIRAAAVAGRRVLPAVDAAERAAERALREVREVQARLEESYAKRNELRGRLDAYEAMAADGGLAEDVDLAARYRQAREPLWGGQCDLSVAAEAVDWYVRAVREKLGGGSDQAAS